MKRIAIIPARGGSKRIPKKNIIDFNNKPLIVWTIEAALDSGCFNQVLVSTDCLEIAEIARNAGASVPFLRLNNADDTTPVSTATVTALIQAEEHWKTRFNEIVQLMPNCPLRNSQHICKAVANFLKEKNDYQISCFQFGWMNPWWAAKLNQDMKPIQLFPDALSKRSQDLEELYCPTGAIWIATRDLFLSEKTFYGSNHSFFPMDWIGAVDIDNIDDYKMALALSRI